MSNAVEVKRNQSPAEMISLAIESKADLDKLEKLLSLQERWEANEAKKAYHKAMAEFKANPPRIDKDRAVSFGNTHYNHASLFNVVEKVGAELSKHGLSATWNTKQNGSITVACKITHILGHSEETSLSASSDKSGSKNEIQAIGSTITYLERYTLLMLTGLATVDQDDDGQAAETEFVTTDEVIDLKNKITDCKANEKKLLALLKVSKLEELTKQGYQEALTLLEAYKKQQSK